MVQVTLWAGLRPLAEDQEHVTIEAATIRELLSKLQLRYPALEQPFRNDVAVAINGTIYRDDWSQGIPEDAEVFLMRRIPGG
ncbi:MoaD/ThiS family protein [Thalassorhabdomicrobium marinisediminis]|uniref:Molybdopterin synthase sulfur carrier subunit n=1 Tax=Thalassorhabdomicrobium marinisediminis TaxID=2170577 RepID=A0A2T7FUA3_9RHOB|nr:MoaD/ThiS family protein [Thalassorhabdomicrobium marinisediminis]PVA05744.1 molybdopterin synthase sulfur carrier subunit [Thalassorhabdomicrobium marinisediminis]